MIYSVKFTGLLDANVLYSAPLRDYLLNLAQLDLYRPKWSEQIHDEWIESLLLERQDLSRKNLLKTKAAMDAAFPDAMVTGYEDLIEGLDLKDKDDRHVLAAAIRANAHVIVTDNLRDFPESYLRKFDIEAQNPDVFVSNLIDLDKDLAMEALINQVASLKNPPLTKKQVIETLAKCGLPKSAKLLARMTR